MSYIFHNKKILASGVPVAKTLIKINNSLEEKDERREVANWYWVYWAKSYPEMMKM